LRQITADSDSSYLSHRHQGLDEEKKEGAALMMRSAEAQGDYVDTGG
jgi:hypothetical protein